MRNMFNVELELEKKSDMIRLADILLRAGYSVYYGTDESVNIEVPAHSIYQDISESKIKKFDKEKKDDVL